MKKLLSLFLACILLLGILPTSVFAADSVEEALGEVNIYNGDYELGYLSINGAVKKQTYTYFLYESNDGTTKESPAYCVNPTTPGVPQSVGPGESIKYLAEEKASDPKVVGIISNGYPHRSLGELNLDNKYQAYYATKMALWCYLLPNWNIANLKVAPGLTGSELDIGNRILAAAKDIYKRGTTYNYMLSPRMTVTADKSTAYPVTIDGQAYLQQVFTVWSETWVYDYDVTVSFSDPGSVPDGTKIVDANNNEITAVTTQPTSDGYAGTFKVLYLASSVEGQSGNVQLSLSAPVAQYAAMYAVCQEKDKYGELQNYICDLDNNVRLDVAAISSYADGGEPGPDETALKIVKLEEGTELPLEGAVFSIYDPEGRKVEESVSPSPFDYQKNCLLYFPAMPPRQHEADYFAKLAEEIRTLVIAVHGHALVLFTSYAAMSAVKDHLKRQPLPFPLFTMGRNAPHTMAQFKAAPGSVLFATGAAWEGFDFPGDCVSLLVIPRLPFQYPDALQEKKREAYPDLRSFIRAVAVPEMQIKLKQGFGRAIRMESDTCVIAILDERSARGSRYFKDTRTALPPMPMTSSIYEVARFIRRVKDNGYFEEAA